jgi:hypothetical protein
MSGRLHTCLNTDTATGVASNEGEVLDKDFPLFLNVCGKTADYGIGCRHNFELL